MIAVFDDEGLVVVSGDRVVMDSRPLPMSREQMRKMEDKWRHLGAPVRFDRYGNTLPAK